MNHSIRLRHALAAGAVALGTLASTAHAKTFVYVSNADSEDISAFQLDDGNGTLTPIQTLHVGGTAMPMALSPDHHHLYAGLRSKPYRVLSLAINPLDGQLIPLGSAPLPESMAYLSVDNTGRYLFGASYGGNMLSASHIDATGIARDAYQTFPTGPMAHAIRSAPDNRYVFASVLGSDVWLRFKFDASTGELTQDAAPGYRLPANSGPRHFVFSADGKRVYLIDELDGKLHVLAFDQSTDTVKPIQTVSIVPPDFGTRKPWGADLHLTPDGRFLYTSERTSSTLNGFSVEAHSGKLTRIGTWATETQPRGFDIDPSGHYLFAVGQLSNHLSAYRIDPASGALKASGQYETGKNPNWVTTVKFD
ncbi:beta-propeller fold lactonase family protein [Paraburkholderia sp.]|uniref:lactonase family protein n=1 Tax=Paraburkholderia sp. TaxID=1926495 RepID=UPI002394AA7C|nr:beta-propeller fold lactonase family protein [Paraburkholderia sp.]MDE1180457.1 beta-propeller fold lactonase family protein [Paraburkholderia sp.]